MALDFPASPLTGDKYPVPAVAGQPQYTYDGLKWTTVGAQITNAKPADAVPLPEALQGAIGVSADYAREDHVHPLNTSLLVKKNYIINGAMRINQEWGGMVVIAGHPGSYPADMFKISGNTAITSYTAQEQLGTPGGSTYVINLSSGEIFTPIASSALSFEHAIEGRNYADMWQPTPKVMTLRFGIRATKPGTYCVSFRNYNGTRSYVAEYTISAAEATNFTVKTITLTADTFAPGPWDYGSAAGLVINWTVLCGATYQTATPNTWQNGNYFATANQVNWSDALNNRFTLYDVGLYEGPVAPPYQIPDYATELTQCQRYFEKTYPYADQVGKAYGTTNGGGPIGWTTYSPNNYPVIFYSFKQRKRTAPTARFHSPYTGALAVAYAPGIGDSASCYADYGSETGMMVVAYFTAQAPANQSIYTHVVVDARL